MPKRGATLQEIAAVYQARGRDFYRLALARTGDPAAAQDAVQEGFARAIRARSAFRGSGRIEAWIGRCVLNAARETATRRARTSPLPPDFEHLAAEDDRPESAVRDAIRELPVRQRDALFLRFYVGLDYAEIAEALGVATGTVSSSLHAARQTLSHALEEVAQ